MYQTLFTSLITETGLALSVVAVLLSLTPRQRLKRARLGRQMLCSPLFWITVALTSGLLVTAYLKMAETSIFRDAKSSTFVANFLDLRSLPIIYGIVLIAQMTLLVTVATKIWRLVRPKPVVRAMQKDLVAQYGEETNNSSTKREVRTDRDYFKVLDDLCRESVEGRDFAAIETYMSEGLGQAVALYGTLVSASTRRDIPVEGRTATETFHLVLLNAVKNSIIEAATLARGDRETIRCLLVLISSLEEFSMHDNDSSRRVLVELNANLIGQLLSWDRPSKSLLIQAAEMLSRFSDVTELENVNKELIDLFDQVIRTFKSGYRGEADVGLQAIAVLVNGLAPNDTGRESVLRVFSYIVSSPECLTTELQKALLRFMDQCPTSSGRYILGAFELANSTQSSHLTAPRMEEIRTFCRGVVRKTAGADSRALAPDGVLFQELLTQSMSQMPTLEIGLELIVWQLSQRGYWTRQDKQGFSFLISLVNACFPFIHGEPTRATLHMLQRADPLLKKLAGPILRGDVEGKSVQYICRLLSSRAGEDSPNFDLADITTLEVAEDLATDSTNGTVEVQGKMRQDARALPFMLRTLRFVSAQTFVSDKEDEGQRVKEDRHQPFIFGDLDLISQGAKLNPDLCEFELRGVVARIAAYIENGQELNPSLHRSTLEDCAATVIGMSMSESGDSTLLSAWCLLFFLGKPSLADKIGLWSGSPELESLAGLAVNYLDAASGEATNYSRDQSLTVTLPDYLHLLSTFHLRRFFALAEEADVNGDYPIEQETVTVESTSVMEPGEVVKAIRLFEKLIGAEREVDLAETISEGDRWPVACASALRFHYERVSEERRSGYLINFWALLSAKQSQLPSETTRQLHSMLWKVCAQFGTPLFSMFNYGQFEDLCSSGSSNQVRIDLRFLSRTASEVTVGNPGSLAVFFMRTKAHPSLEARSIALKYHYDHANEDSRSTFLPYFFQRLQKKAEDITTSRSTLTAKEWQGVLHYLRKAAEAFEG